MRWSPSLIALLLANLLPLFGVLFWGWEVDRVLLLYWAESAIVGIFNVLKLIRVSGVEGFFLVPFFIVHFGGFMAGHLVFLLQILREGRSGDWVAALFDRNLILCLVALFVSHGVSYVTNWLGRGEWRDSNAGKQMMAPYGRIVLMHFAIIFGGMAALYFGQPLPLLLILIGGKIAIDMFAHAREHRHSLRRAAQSKGETGTS